MDNRVEHRKKTRKRGQVSRQERGKQQRRFQKQLVQQISEMVRESLERALQGEVTLLLGRAKGERRDLADPREAAASCNRCQIRRCCDFYRAGFYRRSILTSDTWIEIRVPRVSCICGGMVDFELGHLEPYNRVWFDLEERARELAGICVSLRDSVEVLSWRNEQPLSIATLNGRVNQTAELAEAFHQGEFSRIPQVVMLDGIWLKVLLPTDKEYVDKRGRRRKRYKLRKFPLLVAYGVDPTSGERWVLDWERGESEDQASWQRFLERLLERGLHAEKGLRLFIHDGSAGLEKAFEFVWFGKGVERQRCIFHKLRNVQRDVVGSPEMTKKEHRARRTAVLKDAREVYRGKDESEIRQCLETFRAKWLESEPKAVATLGRDFDQTLVYLKVLEEARLKGEEWRVECLRTTSLLERVQRHFRQKARQVVIAHSEKGVAAGIELVIRHRGLALADKTPESTAESWSRLLEQALLAA